MSKLILMDPITPFDLQRMFIGNQPPLFFLEIVVRIVLIYVFSVFVLSFMGKRGRREMSPFEYMVIIALGSATGDSMFYPDVPLLYAFLVITTIVVLNQAVSALQYRNRRVHKFIEGEPGLLVKNGHVLRDNLKRERMTEDELFSMLREAKIENVGEVRYAFLELSGELGLILYDEGERVQGMSTLIDSSSKGDLISAG